MSSPALSVVLLNWNGAHLLPICLASLRRQTFQDFEIIVPDNGSTDGSLELLARDHPDARVLKFDHNRGFCLAMNDGMRAARGEFIFSLNNDTELDPRCLEEVVAAMRADPRLGICATKMIYYDDPGLINSAGLACAPDGVVVDIGRGLPDSDWFDRPREVLGACAGACLYRRAMLEEVGLFDPDYFISYEDIDLAWRAQLAGWRAWYVPTAVVKHMEGVTRQIRSRRGIFLAARNITLVWTKDWPLLFLLRHLPAVCRGWRRRAYWLVLAGYASSVPAMVFSTLALTPYMLARRWRIQRDRAVGLGRLEELLAVGARHTRRPPED
jgi:GT2 family glycosyltransferase